MGRPGGRVMTAKEQDQALRFIEFTSDEIISECIRRYPRGILIARIEDEGEEVVPYFDYKGDEIILVDLCVEAICVIKSDDD